MLVYRIRDLRFLWQYYWRLKSSEMLRRVDWYGILHTFVFMTLQWHYYVHEQSTFLSIHGLRPHVSTLKRSSSGYDSCYKTKRIHIPDVNLLNVEKRCIKRKVEGRIEVTGIRGRRSKRQLDDRPVRE